MSDSKHEPDKTPGLISWNELVTKDAEGSQAFYTQLFGWQVETIEMGQGSTYGVFNAGARPVAGMLPMPPEAGGVPTMWMGYVTVESLQDTVGKAQALGARVLKEITQLPMGRFAVIADPQGAVIGLWEFPKEGGETT